MFATGKLRIMYKKKKYITRKFSTSVGKKPAGFSPLKKINVPFASNGVLRSNHPFDVHRVQMESMQAMLEV